MKATRLKNPDIKKVDLVPAGANQGAAVKLFKSKEPKGDPQPGKEENILTAIINKIKDAFSMDETLKKMVTFSEAKRDEKITSLLDRNWWDYMSALRKSIESILKEQDMEIEAKKTEVLKSLTEFAAAILGLLFDPIVQEDIQKAGKKICGDRLKRMKSMWADLGKVISEAEGVSLADLLATVETDTKKSVDIDLLTIKEVVDTMKIDKSRMTPEELAALEVIEKKYGSADDKKDEGTPPTSTVPVVKKDEKDPPAGDGGGESAVLKTLTTTLEVLTKKFDALQESTEIRDLEIVAKKYEILGHKPDELAKTLRGVKKTGQAAYDSMIQTLDKAAELVEKSGLFGEVGKGGANSANTTDDVMKKIETFATEIRKADPKISYSESITKAFDEHPDLKEQYESERE